MNADAETRRRDAMAQATRKIVEATGGKLTTRQAEDRVRRAVVSGDQKREAGNR